ncbi:hypothetical protein FS837_002042 [Tulasnella sp. UAMH 9824]|nr:hypothetical protein FS837_002042 [Tulasnella sp. UAMH 9824]
MPIQQAPPRLADDDDDSEQEPTQLYAMSVPKHRHGNELDQSGLSDQECHRKPKHYDSSRGILYQFCGRRCRDANAVRDFDPEGRLSLSSILQSIDPPVDIEAASGSRKDAKNEPQVNPPHPEGTRRSSSPLAGLLSNEILTDADQAPSEIKDQASISSHDDDISHFIISVSSQPICINGRFGDVFKGTHKTVGEVALKRLRIGGSALGEQVIRRFEREADTWRRLRHPHMLKFLGTYKPEGFLYFVSPFMKNGTLLEYVYERPDVNRVRLPMQLCETSDALGYLHGEEIVHGDIKAGNLLISDDGQILVCDFGLTKSIHAQTSTAVKGAGTLRWQSPELWDNIPKTYASDVYAFAMTIVEVLDP